MQETLKNNKKKYIKSVEVNLISCHEHRVVDVKPKKKLTRFWKTY